MTLQELWSHGGHDKYITDKGSGHSYLPVYDELFKPYQDQPVNIFEIGHSAGGALRLFDDYFTHPETKIIGIDQSDNDWHIFYGGKPYRTPRVKTYLMDVHELDEHWFIEKGFLPDIVIEDSNHQLNTQLFVVKMIFPLVKAGGMLVIEDVLDPQERKPLFDNLGIPCMLYDLNPILPTRDNALIVYMK